MSKKSRRRNRKILGLLAAGLGAAAIARGRGTTAANVDSGRGGDSSSAAARVAANAVAPTQWVTKKTAPVESTPVETRSVPFQNRMTGHGPQVNETISRGERARALAANAAKNRAMNYQRSQTFDAKPKFGPLSNARVNQPGSSIIRQYKKGGRVKGVGKAKRGFGRALKGGK